MRARLATALLALCVAAPAAGREFRLDANASTASFDVGVLRFFRAHGTFRDLSGTLNWNPETRELIAGFWIWKVNSMEEAVEWVKRIPYDYEEAHSDGEVEIRRIFEAEDFGPEFTPELREQEDRVRAKAEKLKES